MNRFLIAACASLTAAAVASPSLAADLPRPTYAPSYKAPVYVAPAFTWTGFYVGINGGYGWGTSRWTDPATGITTGDFDVKGWLGGGTLGYNFQFGSIVAGVEGDFDYAAILGRTTASCAAPGCETRNTWLATARARLGYAFGSLLPFVTGGAAFGGIRMTPPGGPSEDKTVFGWTLGAGLEYAFLGNWSAKVEYLYADLGKTTCSAGTCGTSTDVRYRPNLVRAGVNMRF
jgi:outer membrane immunogenic protein